MSRKRIVSVKLQKNCGYADTTREEGLCEVTEEGSMDDSRYRLNFDLDRKNKIHHYS